MPFKKIWKIIKQSFSDFIDTSALKHSAALAYYTIFSLPAILIIIIWVSNIFYGREIVEGSIYTQLSGFVGQDAAVQIQDTIRNASTSAHGPWAAVVGIITLIIGATGVFAEIQESINHIWHLKSKPRKGRGWLRLLINRLISFSMVITLGFLLLVSLVINGLMDVLLQRFAERFPDLQVYVLYAFNIIFTFFVTATLFGIIFKILPDARIKWKDVRAGAITTAILFMGGRFLISFYLGQTNRITSAYGAAGSLIVILIWVYYSAIILFFGAVFTRVYAIGRGCQIYPNDYAVWVEQREVESHESLKKHEKDNPVNQEDPVEKKV
ncbi:MAG: YihY/virulence factor BrkB family protein [Chitinophagaceae bacterium]|nr:YihY/virulence factor BrkB family protein [Chitinophagaceae bacterium]